MSYHEEASTAVDRKAMRALNTSGSVTFLFTHECATNTKVKVVWETITGPLSTEVGMTAMADIKIEQIGTLTTLG